MQQLIHEAYETKNWEIISEIFHNKTELLEVKYALSLEDFKIFISTFQLIQVSHQGMELITGQLYYFLTGGFFAKKVEKTKETKNRRNCNRKAITNNDVRSLRNFTTPIEKESLSSIQDFLCTESRSTGFYYSNINTNIVLRLKYSKLEANMTQKLLNYYLNKLKFLNKLTMFKEVPKNIIQENLEKFKFTKLSFNDLIYGKNLRSSSVFVLMKGEAIVENARQSPGFIVNPPEILGDSKSNLNEQARCLTEYCILFSIEKSQLEDIFRRKALTNYKQFEGNSVTPSIGLLRAKYLRQFQLMSEKNSKQSESSLNEQANSVDTTKIQSLIHNHRNKKISNFSCNKQKKQRIKEHFSNFLSDKFKQYSTKLEREKNFDQCKQTPILYQLKPPCQSPPNYEQMQARLKRQRIKKILEVKQNLQRSNSSKSLLKYSQNETSRYSHQIEKDCIDAKIERNLNYKIGKEINKRYGSRTILSKIKVLV